MPTDLTSILGALVSLSAMELVLGIDNIVFISILVEKLPAEARAKMMRLGIGLALLLRMGLLLALQWMMGLTAPLFAIFGNEFSGRDLILVGGGLFLIFKASHEIYQHVEAHEHQHEALIGTPDEMGSDRSKNAASKSTKTSVLFQILAVDLVFSLDSVITAVGMASQIWVMVVAMLVAVAGMLVFAGTVSRFVQQHPSVKLLALSFLMMIGTMLLADGFGSPIPKGYIYTSMAFSLGVELLNLRRKQRAPKTVA